jgi:hypothetical protein
MCHDTIGFGLIDIQFQPNQNFSSLQIVDGSWLGIDDSIVPSQEFWQLS